MMSKKTAKKRVNHFNSIVFDKVSDISELIGRHSDLGQEDMEVYVEAKMYTKMYISLKRKGFHVKSSKFEAMPECLLMYVSWSMRV